MKKQSSILYSYNGRQHMLYEIHAIVELTLFLYDDKECIYHCSLC